MSLLRATTIILLASVIAPDVTAAQPATPRANVEECAVERRELSAVVAILSAPPATPQATPEPEQHTHAPATPARPATAPIGTPRLLRPELPPGEPVDAETTAALTETMRRYVACANASDVIGLMSLVSDDFLRQTFGAGAVSEADLRAYAANARPVPVERRWRLVAIRDGRRLADGRIVALVDTAPVSSTNPAAINTDLVTFTQVNGRYLVDRYVAGVTVWYGPNASPTP